jgi:hypothetical protein
VTALVAVTAGLLTGVAEILGMTPGVAQAAVRFSVPVEPDRASARGWAIRELAKSEYQTAKPGPIRRALAWLLDQLQSVTTPGGTGIRLATLIALVVAAIVVTIAVVRSGTLRRPAGGGAVFADPTRTAAEYRAAAEAAELREDWPAAVIERFRAVTRELEERAVLVPLPGRTADEAAVEASAWLPDVAPALRRAAIGFDEVHYGGQPASAAAARALRDLDDAVRRVKPVASTVVPVLEGPVAPQ